MTSPINPKPDNRLRVFRGGSWLITSATDVRAVVPHGTTPTLRDDSLGFRLTQTGCRGSR